MTEALAIIGAVSGITGAVLAIGAFVRDRAKIEVTHVESISRYDPEDGQEDVPEDEREEGPGLVIFIANHGRQPIAVTEAGVRTHGKTSIRQMIILKRRYGWSLRQLMRVRPDPDRWAWFVLDRHEEPVVLGLGELRKLEMPRENLGMLLGTKDEDLPLYSFAVDSRRRTTMSGWPVNVDFLRGSLDVEEPAE